MLFRSELHGGTIIAASEVGVGSTFTIHLPLSTKLPHQPTLPASLPLQLDSTGAIVLADVPNLNGIHVLLVDDETDIRTLMTEILEQYGATVTATATAATALAALQANPQAYQVLLSDIGMPGQDGWVLIRQIRSLSAEAGGLIPAAALTAYASNRDRSMAIQLGFQSHIAKPIEPAKLAAIVADLARE